MLSDFDLVDAIGSVVSRTAWRSPHHWTHDMTAAQT
jgi:hypothetical protein